MRSVRDFKNLFIEETHFSVSQSMSRPRHAAFWDRLNRLGWAKKTKDPGECEDLDATAPLTDEEWNNLVAEMQAL